MDGILLIVLGISLVANLVMSNSLRDCKPKRDRNGRFIKKKE